MKFWFVSPMKFSREMQIVFFVLMAFCLLMGLGIYDTQSRFLKFRLHGVRVDGTIVGFTENARLTAILESTPQNYYVLEFKNQNGETVREVHPSTGRGSIGDKLTYYYLPEDPRDTESPSNVERVEISLTIGALLAIFGPILTWLGLSSAHRGFLEHKRILKQMK